jgi:hypothetical protein
MPVYGAEFYVTFEADNEEQALEQALLMMHGHVPLKDLTGDGFVVSDSIAPHK